MADANIRKMDNKRYDSHLTDQEYAILEPLLPKPKRRGRRRSVVLHEILNGIFYILRGGVPWRMLPGVPVHGLETPNSGYAAMSAGPICAVRTWAGVR